jgi:hypothetical protein
VGQLSSEPPPFHWIPPICTAYQISIAPVRTFHHLLCVLSPQTTDHIFVPPVRSTVLIFFGILITSSQPVLTGPLFVHNFFFLIYVMQLSFDTSDILCRSQLPLSTLANSN